MSLNEEIFHFGSIFLEISEYQDFDRWIEFNNNQIEKPVKKSKIEILQLEV